MNTRAIHLYLNEAHAELKRAWRTPAFTVPTLMLPWAFYALFAIVLGTPGSGTAGYALATYGIYAALAPAMFGFGAGIAGDRDSGILALKRAAPLPPGAFLFARLAAAMAFTLIVLVGLYALAAWGAGVQLPRGAWARLAAVHLTAVIPLCLLGLCVGLRAASSAALALSNMLFFGMAVLGGLWIPLVAFPQWLQELAVAIPTSHLAALALAAAGGGGAGGVPGHVLAVLGFSAACAMLAWRSWTRAVS
jgi:ABC-2 type transport system permease protein